MPTGEAASRLCAACGMCCNGIMFHGVKLQPGDSARALAALGIKVKRRKSESFFPQPCSAHQGSCCAIYAQRPARCRLFSCGQLKRVTAGEISEADAREAIREAKIRAERVRGLLQLAGDVREHKAFAIRHEAVFAEPRDPEPNATRLRDDLVSAMGDLELLLAKEFRVDPA